MQWMRGAGRRTLDRLARNEAGATMLAFVIVGMPLMAGSSLAIEYGRALKVRSELQDAADAAVRRTADRLGAGGQTIYAALRTTLDAQLRPSLRGLPFAYTMAGGSLDLSVHASVATPVATLIGRPAFRFAISGSARVQADTTRAQGGSSPRSPTPGDVEPDAAEDGELTLARGISGPVTVKVNPLPKG
jgi:hypothetical protein